jgi:hypothetical protein
MSLALATAVLMTGCADGTSDSGPTSLPKAAAQAAQTVLDLQAKGEVISAEKAQQIMAQVEKASAVAVQRFSDWQLRGGPAQEGKEVAAPFVEARADLEYLIRTLYNVDPAQAEAEFSSYMMNPHANRAPMSGADDYQRMTCFAFVGVGIGACTAIPGCWPAIAGFCAAYPPACAGGAAITVALCTALPEWW